MVPPVPNLRAPPKANESTFRGPVFAGARLHYGSPLFGYVLALSLTVVGGFFRLELMERSGFVFPFLFFYPGIVIASFLGGVGPGMAAIVMAFLAAFAYVLSPYPAAPWNWIALAVVGPLLTTGFAYLRSLRDRDVANTRELANFKLIGDHASDWILLIDESGLIRYVNLKASTDLGWTDRELTGRHIESLVAESQRSNT